MKTVVLLLGLALCALGLGVPNVPDWPNQFSMSFRDSGGKNGMMYYNWDIRRQRVDHDAGAQECVKFLETPDPCTLLFGPKRWNAYFPANKSCCLGELTGLIRPDFVKTQEYRGVVKCPCNESLLCDAWGVSPNGSHGYYNVVDSGVPCAFIFKAASTANFLFNVDTFKVAPQDPSLFVNGAVCEKECPTNQPVPPGAPKH